ncbi:pyridoxal phosphate-dependent transferase [Hyaloraphidium curvatum]|nr:pyridoxal phosphate-dependent transferase [Hyaloraphidium curvatum]
MALPSRCALLRPALARSFSSTPRRAQAVSTRADLATEAAVADYLVNSIAKGVGRSTKIVAERGEGVWIYSMEGKKYLDSTTGIGVTSTGHSHPTVVKAVQDQAAKIPHVQQNIMFHRPMSELVARMKQIMPDPSLDTFFFWNSGAEAVEASIKLARHATGKPNVIVVNGSYHGRTMGTMAMTTSKTIYRTGFGPLMPGVFVAPFPYVDHCSKTCDCAGEKRGVPGVKPPAAGLKCTKDAIAALETLLKTQSAPEETCAVILEPVLGEGGYVVPPADYLAKLKEVCAKNNILLIADEVQTGVGRTGKMWAVEHFGVVPDIMIFAKGIASGYPLSGIVSRKELMDKQPPGSMGGTYGGNAVACAAAVATLDVFAKEKLLENAAARSKQAFSLLQSNLPQICTAKGIEVNVRGLGLMIGIEFSGEKVKKGFANAISEAAMKRQEMFVLTTSIYETLRLIPPINVTEGEMAEIAKRLFAAVEEVVKDL